MVSESFEFREPSHFTAGAVGDPGRRVFYLQAAQSSRLVSLKIEKQQVVALATFLQTVLEDLPAPTGEPESPELVDPPATDWTVGRIAVGVDEASGRVVLVVEELVADDEAAEPGAFDPAAGPDDAAGATLRLHLSLEQAAGFVRAAAELMRRGRPPCRLCGQPIDPDGHPCPRLN
jgi:uncharacterized repeat protein (TIGR03847 family)